MDFPTPPSQPETGLPGAYPGLAKIELTMGQRFEMERFSRAIDATADVQALQKIAKDLLQAWQTQKAATNWVMRQQLGAPSPLRP